jgi:hypothetical protein
MKITVTVAEAKQILERGLASEFKQECVNVEIINADTTPFSEFIKKNKIQTIKFCIDAIRFMEERKQLAIGPNVGLIGATKQAVDYYCDNH